MGVDYAALSTWKTPDLLFRDGRLLNSTRVMGMSQSAAIIHSVALVCTLGASLPINVAFGIWHIHSYDKVKKERMWIRQILSTRNWAYHGRGHWVQVQTTPGIGQSAQVTPTSHAANDPQNPQADANAAVIDLQMQIAQAAVYVAVNDQVAQTADNAAVTDLQQESGNYDDTYTEAIVADQLGLLELLAS